MLSYILSSTYFSITCLKCLIVVCNFKVVQILKLSVKVGCKLKGSEWAKALIITFCFLIVNIWQIYFCSTIIVCLYEWLLQRIQTSLPKKVFSYMNMKYFEFRIGLKLPWLALEYLGHGLTSYLYSLRRNHWRRYGSKIFNVKRFNGFVLMRKKKEPKLFGVGWNNFMI